MKKLAVFAVILIVVLLVLGLSLDSLASGAIESGAEYALGVDTTVDSVKLGLFSGRFGVGGLSIANPPGWEAERFFALREARLSVGLRSLMGETIEVGELAIEGVDLNLEAKGTKTNLDAILANLKRFESGEPPADEPAAEKPGKAFMIKELLIRDVSASVRVTAGPVAVPPTTITVPEIRMQDVGGGEGVDLAELTDQILKAILEAVGGAGGLPDVFGDALAKGMAQLEDVAAQVEGQVQAAVDEAAAQLEEQAGQIQQEAGKAVEDAEKKLKEGLGGLLGGEKDDDG